MEELSRIEGLIVDLRAQAAFANFYLPGSLNIAADPHFAMAAGFVLDPEEEYILLGSLEEIERALSLLYMMGIDKIMGIFPAGVEPWRKAARPAARIAYLTPP